MDRRYRSWRWPRVVGALAGLAVLAGVMWAVWKLPSLLYGNPGKPTNDARLQAATSFRTALVAGLAGLAALGGLFFTNRTYRLTQQGQFTERYTKAIEQLGANDKLDVRLGGIYALERIAVDSKRDHPTVVEVLSAFVREHSQPATPPSRDAADASEEATPPSPMPRPPTDVQAAVTVLGRLPQLRDVSRGDLIGAHLEGANLANAHLERANLAGAHLERADLSGAHLAGTIPLDAHLEEANLVGADLEGANLMYVDGLTQQQLDGANVDRRTQLPFGLRPPVRTPGPSGPRPSPSGTGSPTDSNAPLDY
jgi:Pentapeptide repeats (8 copies)